MWDLLKNAAVYLRLRLNGLDPRPRNKYQGPFIDAMMQFNANRSAEELLAKMDQHHVRQMMIFARQKNPFNSTEHVKDIKAAHSDRFVLGAPKAFDHCDDVKPSFVKEVLQGCEQGLYKFIGELQCVHADKYKAHWGNEITIRGERWINPLADNFLALMDGLDGRNIPVMIHWEFYNWERDHTNFYELFKRYPRIPFIIIHGGFGPAQFNHELLKRFDNVHIMLSKKDLIHLGRWWFTYKGVWINANGPSSKQKQSKLGYAILDPNGRINWQWMNILIEFPDRVLFGTDCHKKWRWQHYDIIIETWRELLGQLEPELAEKIAYKNAQKLFGLDS